MCSLLNKLLFDVVVLYQRVACLLRKVVQEIERRISTQAEHLRTVILLVHILVNVLWGLFERS